MFRGSMNFCCGAAMVRAFRHGGRDGVSDLRWNCDGGQWCARLSCFR